MQFIDHDLAKTPEGHVRNRKECCKKPDKTRKYCLPVTFEDPDEKFFAKDYCVEGRRSFTLFQCDNSEVENQINEITSYLDASMVYGSSQEEEHTLRTFIGGLLEQSTNELLPNSSRGFELPCNTTTNDHRKDSCFEAGDTRANVHPGLLTYHTLYGNITVLQKSSRQFMTGVMRGYFKRPGKSSQHLYNTLFTRRCYLYLLIKMCSESIKSTQNISMMKVQTRP
ncbi:eosinophil peroxidase-like [Ruditapes philippinarum]|uniref:eosinophil peroxidase-like n=1 Tax=Ruditapes philippinarum TaxID=129788 RepID=UPI00295BDA56|nr:eosinophil peroxidase-like [Ruditapes philippinarum]